MKKLCMLLIAICAAMFASAVEPSQTIVYINGAKYYVHTVQKGETIYSIARAYMVDEQSIRQSNPALIDGLKADSKIKIPVTADKSEKAKTTKAERKLRKTFDQHTVTQGETFYAISRRYEIPVQTLIEDNPDIDPAHLHVGSTILIRKKQIGTEDEQGSQAGWEAYRDQLNSISDSLAYHIVVKGDTFYSLSKKYGITEQELGAMNDGLLPENLKLGAMIRVPAPEKAEPQEQTQEQQEPAEQAEQADSTLVKPTRKTQIFLQALRSNERLKVALMLPLEVKGEANPSYAEFYQGFLMGLDSMKTRFGHSVEVTLYNTARDAEQIRSILEQPSFEGTRLIIGPVYESGLEPVVQYAEDHEIPVVSPLAHLSEQKSDILFQMAPAPQYKYDKVKEFFGEDRRITLVYAGTTDQEFEREILGVLGNREYRRFDFHYTHGAGANSSSNLAPTLENNDDNVFIIMAENEVEIERILAALASADTNLIARGHTPPRFAVLGNARWNRYNNLDRSVFFKDRVTFVSTYHAKRDVALIQDFDSAYIRSFGSLPTLYAYRGYDTAMIFIPAMYNDIAYDLEERSFTPLQTTYKFAQTEEGANHINTTWMRVNYQPDFTITTE